MVLICTGLDPDDLTVLVDRSHNGLLALSDGTLITKDLRLEGQGGTTITRLHPDTLELVHEPLVLPEGSMGRVAADLDSVGNEHVYVPGSEHLWRIQAHRDSLAVDDWRPRYRTPHDTWGMAWDACISDRACWIMDCGDIESVRLSTTPSPTAVSPFLPAVVCHGGAPPRGAAPNVWPEFGGSRGLVGGGWLVDLGFCVVRGWFFRVL